LHAVEEDFEKVVRTSIVLRTIQWDKIEMLGKLEHQRAALPASKLCRSRLSRLKKNSQNKMNEAMFLPKFLLIPT